MQSFVSYNYYYIIIIMIIIIITSSYTLLILIKILRTWIFYSYSFYEKDAPFINPAKENKNVELDLVGYGVPGLFFAAYDIYGFLLNNGVDIIGPCAAFPRNALHWNVRFDYYYFFR